MIIFTSDHGEPLNEHGYLRKAKPYFYKELTDVPFILYLPDGSGRGKFFDPIIQSVDMIPTVMDFLHTTADTTYHFKDKWYTIGTKLDGESLLPIIRGEKEKIRDEAFMGYTLRTRGIKTPELTYFYLTEQKPDEEPEYLFVQQEDPEEMKNMVEEKPEVAKEMRGRVDEFYEYLEKRESDVEKVKSSY